MTVRNTWDFMDSSHIDCVCEKPVGPGLILKAMLIKMYSIHDYLGH